MEKKNNVTLAVALVIIGVIGRIVLLNQPNIETVMVAALLGGCLLGGIYSFVIPLAIMFFTDLYIYNAMGNLPFALPAIAGITLFTWSGFIIAGYFGYAVRDKVSYSKKSILKLTFTGILATLFFDLWTNFGWWYLIYPHTAGALMTVLALGVPFALRHLASTLVTVPLVSVPVLYVVHQKNVNLSRVISPLEKYVSIAGVVGTVIFVFISA